jgi:hypothetical protein
VHQNPLGSLDALSPLHPSLLLESIVSMRRVSMEIIAGFGCIFRTSKNKENSYLAFGNFHLKVNIDGVSLSKDESYFLR